MQVAPRPIHRSPASSNSGVVGLMLLLRVAVLALSACNPEMEDHNFAAVNDLRSSVGVGTLARSAELNLKAQLQADRVADAGRIFHSASLSEGVTGGWAVIGENVAAAGSIDQAMEALTDSPGHYDNMVNPAFTEMGVGVTVRNGTVYLVQVFVGR